MRRTGLTVLSSFGGVLLLGFTAVASPVAWTPAHELAPGVVGSVIATGDLDGDGDDDVTDFSYRQEYWNTGCPGPPAWESEGLSFPDASGCAENSCALGDCDADGDVDLVYGCREYVSPRMVWNVGSPQVPTFTYGGAVPGAPGSCWDGRVCLGDLDADGDLDLMIVSSSGVFGVIENQGSATTPYWVWLDVIPGIGFGEPDGKCALGDLDGDGDQDIVGAAMGGSARCWENVGTPQAWSYAENPAMLTGVASPVGGVYGLALPDVDCDGDCDLVMGGWESDVYLYLNENLTPIASHTWGIIKALYR